MSRVVLLFALALALVTFASIAPPKEATRQPNNAPSGEIAAARQSVAAVKQQTEPTQYYWPCRQHEENRSSDLCAQWKAADAAQSAADATWYLGIAGAFLGLLTLLIAIKAALYAKDAAEHTATGAAQARRSANAAELAVGDTRRIGEAQVRCYLTGVSAQVGFISEGRAIVKCTLKNTGHSPARGVECSGSISVSTGESKYVLFSDPHPQQFTRRVDIGAGSTEKITFTIKADFDKWAATDGMFFIQATVKVMAKDVFDEPTPETEKFVANLPIKAEHGAWIELERTAHLT